MKINKIIENCIDEMRSYSDGFPLYEENSKVNEGRNTAVGNIRESIDTRISLLEEIYEGETTDTVAFGACYEMLESFINVFDDLRKDCEYGSDFDRGYLEIAQGAIDHFKKMMVYYEEHLS